MLPLSKINMLSSLILTPEQGVHTYTGAKNLILLPFGRLICMRKNKYGNGILVDILC